MRDRGYDGVAEALISRHNRRMQRLVEVGDMMQRVAMPLLNAYLPLSLFAEELGADPARSPAYSGSTWPDHLSWGLDSVAAAVRMILGLQPIGAGILARTQLERWSSNLEANSEIAQETGENTVDWLTRLWGQPDLRPLEQVTTPVGELFAGVSELLHGRGPLMSLVWLDVADVDEGPTSEQVKLLDMISDTLIVGLHQVRTCLATAAEEKNWDVLATTIDHVRLVAPADSQIVHLFPLVWPMISKHFQSPNVEAQLAGAATGYARVVTAMRHAQDPDLSASAWPALAFGAHRFRAFRQAQRAFEQERAELGDRFQQDGIEEFATEAVLAGEMAAMLAVWLRNDPDRSLPADAFAVCASALRSAQWLWLEDDDRALGCLRCVIEQLARVRTWRSKPERAAKIEINPDSTPRDWIEPAGWRRLNLLSKALGEFAHGSTRGNWSLARDALVTLQDEPDTEVAKRTGRTHALAVAILLVAAESATWVNSLGTDLGDAYRKVIRFDAKRADRAIEELLDRTWQVRATPVR